jgi:hypothetical protein
MVIKYFFFYFVFLKKILCSEAKISFFDNFINTSIYFTSLNNDDNFSLDNYKLEYEFIKPHRTDTVVLKLEKDIRKLKLLKHVKMNMLITSSFYKITACTDIENKDKIFHHFSKYVEILNEKTTCYIRQVYFEPIKKSDNSHNNIMFEKYQSPSNFNFIPQNILDFSFEEYFTIIKKYFSEFIMWNNNCYYEMNFFYNPKLNKFSLDKIFVYFSSKIHEKFNNQENFYFISLIKNKEEVFNNIFIFYRFFSKQMKWTKNYLERGNEKIEFIDYSDQFSNYEINISTKKKESIFHNMISLEFNKNVFQNLISKDEETCMFIYQHITEDVYIEKNEFLNFLYLKHEHNKIQYKFSFFIDQEISSDLSEQYYLTFLICDNLENFLLNEESSKYGINYPIHFRYQPSIYSNSSKIENVLPHPYIEFLAKNRTIVPDLSTILLQYLNSDNLINKDMYYVKIKRDNEDDTIYELYDERKIFSDEVNFKIKHIIQNYNYFSLNKINFNHLIPAGKQNHFYIVLIGTLVVTLLGFLIICYALIYFMTASLAKRSIESEIIVEKKNY